MEQEVISRRRGRPKGSKGKKTNLSSATVQKICEYNKFNPAEKLIHIARGDDKTEKWTADHKLRATEKLFDSIHNNKTLPGNVDNEAGTANYEIVFLESEDSVALPSESDASSDTEGGAELTLSSVGNTSPVWEDSLRDQ
jgi:hypothetical protein